MLEFGRRDGEASVLDDKGCRLLVMRCFIKKAPFLSFFKSDILFVSFLEPILESFCRSSAEEEKGAAEFIIWSRTPNSPKLKV